MQSGAAMSMTRQNLTSDYGKAESQVKGGVGYGSARDGLHSERGARTSRWREWIPVIIWAAVIFWFSTDTFSGEHTRPVIVGVLHALMPSARRETLLRLHAVIRKCAHLGEYFLFGLLVFRAVRAPKSGWQFRWACIAIMLAALYAASDEFHQSFVPSRGPAVGDVLLDTEGATVAQLATWLITRRENYREKEAATLVS